MSRLYNFQDPSRNDALICICWVLCVLPSCLLRGACLCQDSKQGRMFHAGPATPSRADATDYNFDYLGARWCARAHFQHWRARRETTLKSYLTRLTVTRGRHRANVHPQGGSFLPPCHHITHAHPLSHSTTRRVRSREDGHWCCDSSKVPSMPTLRLQWFCTQCGLQLLFISTESVMSILAFQAASFPACP